MIDDRGHYHEEENKRNEKTVTAHHKGREPEGGQETTVPAGGK
jgi:hypothetical protein